MHFSVRILRTYAMLKGDRTTRTSLFDSAIDLTHVQIVQAMHNQEM